MGDQKRFHKTVDERMGEVRVSVGLMRFTVELYEDGKLTRRQRRFRWRGCNQEMFLTGNEFTALVHLERGGHVRCNLSY